MVEPSIIQAVKKKKKLAFKAMYEQTIRYVYSIVMRYVKNEHEYKDVIQEIYARVFLSIDSYDSKLGDFKYWLRRLVINQCFEHYRRTKEPGKLIPIEKMHVSETPFEEDKLTKLTREEIEEYLQAMPDGYKQVFMLTAIDEYSHKEVGELLGISPATSRSQLTRAKIWLRDHLLNNNSNLLARGI